MFGVLSWIPGDLLLCVLRQFTSEGSPEADANCALHQRYLKDEMCAGFVVDGWHVWFSPSAS